MKLPGDIEIGQWNIFFKIYIGKTDLDTYYMRSIKFANKDIYEPNLGANYIGNIKITQLKDKSVLNERAFFHYNSKKEIVNKREYKLYNINKIIKLDGLKSLYEWTEDLLIGKDDENRKLYATNDDKYLYVMAEIKHNATSPVVNIRTFQGNRRYWFYYASNGGIYFSESNYDNWLYMNNGYIFEFKIPLGDIMNMHYGTHLTSIAVFIQDMSIEKWPDRGTITSSNEYIVKYNYNFYTAFKNVIVNKGQNYSIDIEESLNYTNMNIQWLFNNTYINDAIDPIYEIINVNENNIGLYSVNISSEFGYKIIDVCSVKLYKEEDKSKSNILVVVIITVIAILIVLLVAAFLFLKFYKKKSVDKDIEDIQKQKSQQLYEK